MKKPTTTKGTTEKVPPPIYPFQCKARRGRKIQEGDCTPNPELPACQTCPVNRYRQWQETEKQKQKQREKPKTVNLPKTKKVEEPKPKKPKQTKPRASHDKSGEEDNTRLKWEYLKRSPVLKVLYEFLKALRERADWEDLTRQKVEKLVIEHLMGLHEFLTALREKPDWNNLQGPETIEEAAKLVEDHFMKRRTTKWTKYSDIRTWAFKIMMAWAFGDMTGPFPYAAFEEWIEHWKEVEEKGYEKLSKNLVRDIRFDIEDFLRSSWEAFMLVEGREPTIHELIERIDGYFGPDRNDPVKTHFLRLQYVHGTQEEFEEIRRKVGEIIKPGRPGIKFKKEPLERYLRAYDLGEKWVMRKKTDNSRSMARRDIKRAWQILNNLENLKIFWWRDR